MLSRRAFIDYAALPHFDLKTCELFISALVRVFLSNSHHAGLHFGVEQFEQIAPADRVDQYRAGFDCPPAESYPIAMARDAKANNPRSERLVQNLGVSRL